MIYETNIQPILHGATAPGEVFTPTTGTSTGMDLDLSDDEAKIMEPEPDNEPLTNAKVVDMFRQHGLHHVTSYVKNVMSTAGLSVPQTRNCVDQNIQYVIKHFRKLPGKEILESYLSSSNIFPAERKVKQLSHSNVYACNSSKCNGNSCGL